MSCASVVANWRGVVEAVNATGYGLTLGIHSRLDSTIDFVVEHARAGNIYVNRNIVGAVVGVQPFGGEGKSGTGPKAGGPLYLRALVRESASRRNSCGYIDSGRRRTGKCRISILP